ncbi:MAG TPA: bifunctional phosphopantothenoylcysteine decarboxylase/phosphopantothenate--cysteine ligase CoaBC [Proteobacteria bacterium]|nr:coenzyme A biosynthesis bifunctional protein CoaBC [bacterium BMS3Abin14]HDL54151.1 bifunctional phosphopantothenoylcysteine decarboxylase/phosphopantothenate--cysteine ligase CoaBC [Pseudomonadota bacterium]
MADHSNLKGKNVLLAVTGGIGAYKSVEIARALVRIGAEVSVVMTRNATRFITPLTMEALTRNPVGVDLFSLTEKRSIDHIERGRRADLMVVAPATANFLAKAAHGAADDLVTTILLTVDCPVVVAPAMNSRMWNHPAVRDNMAILHSRGVLSIPPGHGELACGEEGPGRLADLENIIDGLARAVFGRGGDLSEISAMVTAGPTAEPLDPVRFLTNRSSGKMGYALAEAAHERGARVVLISGPSSLPPPAGVQVVNVDTAEEMLAAARIHIVESQWFLMAAAVADYRPSVRSGKKIKKSGKKNLTVELEANPDILCEIAKEKGDRLFVGFAAESENLIGNAKDKLEAKSLDMIVANDITEEGSGFQSDNNRAALIQRDGTTEELPLLPKRELADRILDRMLKLWRMKAS